MRFLTLACAALACLLPAASARPARPCYEQRNLRTISSIYNLTVYPNQIPVIASGGPGVPKGLFNANVTGRIDPVGKFVGFQDSIEYFFALAPIPGPATNNVAITGFQITEFSSGCADVATSVVYLYCSIYAPGQPGHGTPVAPLKQVAFWKFDQNGAVEKYDAWIPNLNNWVQSTTGLQLSNPQVQGGSIQQLCATTQQRCTGANQQWASFDECVATLSARRYGDYNEAWGDNIVCRSIHIFLTLARPEHHCPHVGPTGGGKCVDVPYGQDYFTDEALYGDPVGETFKCKARK